MSLQSTIEAIIATLSPSERRVAEIIRSNPSVVLTHSITELADASSTSMATVVRFCRSIGLPGYSNLRMQLATELGMEAAQFGPTLNSGADIHPDDSLSEAMAKIAGLEKLAIDETVAATDLDRLAHLADLIDKAPRILCFGMGGSHLVAEDLCQKLLRMNHNALCPNDSHDAWVHAGLAPQGTVAIGFSHSGQTDETARFLSTARERGATTVAVTSVTDSAVAAMADMLIRTVARDTSLRTGAMVSRTAQLCVVDMVSVAVARLHYDDTLAAMKVASRVIRTSKN